jgi:anti-sigma B factor antagonist
MDIRWRLGNGVATLELHGRLTVSPGESEIGPLRAAVSEVIAEGYRDIAFNLAELTHLDARGLGELVVARETVRRHGGRLTLVAPPSRVARMLCVTRLDTVFELSETDAALARPEGSRTTYSLSA